MATYQQQRKTTVDPQTGVPLTPDPADPAATNVNISQRRSTYPESGTTGIIIAVVLVLIGAILAFNYGWFGGDNSPNVTQNNTTETAPAVTEPDTTTTGTTGTTGTDTTGTETTGTGTTGTGTTGTGTSTTQ